MIIVIASAKGGSGKTTTAMHLAAWLSHQTKGDIALYDADPNQDCFTWYQTGTESHPQSFDLIPLNDDIDMAAYEHVVIDSAGGRDDSLAELMEYADLLLIPSRPALLDLKNAIATIELLDLPPEKVKILLTHCDARRDGTTQQAFTYLEENELPHCDYYILRKAIIEDSPALGATVNQLKGKPASIAWEDYSEAFTAIWGDLD